MRSDQDVLFNEKSLAYYNAYFSGYFSQPFKNGKFPKFDKHAPVLGKVKLKKQSVADQVMIVKQLHAAFGGTLTIKNQGS